MDNEYSLYLSNVAKLDLTYLYNFEETVHFLLKIKSYKFSGEHKFCLRKNYLSEIILLLRQIGQEMKGICNIYDSTSSSFIQVKFVDKDLIVNGQIGFDDCDNFLKFEFTADQTLVTLLESVFINFKNA